MKRITDCVVTFSVTALTTGIHQFLETRYKLMFDGVSLGYRIAASIVLAGLLWLTVYWVRASSTRRTILTQGRWLALSYGSSLALTVTLILAGRHLARAYPGLFDLVVLIATLIGLLSAVTTATLSYAWVEVKLVRSATTATAVIFRPEGNEPSVLLVYNERFKWWLPPGGHFDWAFGEQPEETARARAESEAGVKVSSIEGDRVSAYHRIGKFERFRQAHFLFWLDVPPDTCHSKHLDFCYVFEYAGDAKARKANRTLWVKLSGSSQDSIEQALRSAIRDCRAPNDADPLPDVPFPGDLPYRIAMALNLFGQRMGSARV